jgi:putative lysine transport system permease protein
MNFWQDAAYILEKYYIQILQGIAATVILAIIGTVVGLFIGIFIALGKRQKIKETDFVFTKAVKYFVKGICWIYSTFLRGTPMMVQALIFKFVCLAFGLNWTNVLYGIPVLDGWLVAGLIVITLNTAAYMCEIVISGLNGIDKGQEEGATSLGMNSMKTLFLVLLPQALRNSLPTIGNELIVNIKDSSVLNVIGVTELFYISKDIYSLTYKAVATYLIIAIIYLILTLIATGCLKYIELKMDHKKIKINFFTHYKAKGI